MSGGYVLKKQGEDPLLYFNLLYILVGLYRHIFTYNKWPLRITIKSFALGDCNALIEYAIAEVGISANYCTLHDQAVFYISPLHYEPTEQNMFSTVPSIIHPSAAIEL